MQPLFGALSDRIGRRTSMLCFGALATIGTVPLLHALKDVTSPVMAFVLVVVALAIVSFYTSISGLIKAEMFPPEVRALGVGLSYAVANAVFGGSAEYVALYLKSIGSESTFYLVRHRDVRDFAHRFFPHARSEQGRLFAQRTLNVPVNRLHENARFWRRALLFIGRRCCWRAKSGSSAHASLSACIAMTVRLTVNRPHSARGPELDTSGRAQRSSVRSE